MRGGTRENRAASRSSLESDLPSYFAQRNAILLSVMLADCARSTEMGGADPVDQQVGMYGLGGPAAGCRLDSCSTKVYVKEERSDKQPNCGNILPRSSVRDRSRTGAGRGPT